MPAVLTQLVYLKYRASAPAAQAVFSPKYRAQLDAQSTLRGRGNADSVYRSRGSAR